MQGAVRNALPKALIAVFGGAMVIASTLYLLPNQTSFALILGLASFPVAVLLTLMVKPEYLWLIVVLSFMSLPYLFVRAEMGTLLVPISAFIASSVMVGLLLRQIFSGVERRVDRNLLVACFLFVAANLLSLYNSALLTSSVSSLLKWVFHGALFISLISTLREQRGIRLLTFAFVAVMTMISVAGLYRNLVLETRYDIDLFGEYATRTAPAYYLAITLPLGISLLWDPLLSMVKRWMVFLAVVVSGVALVLTYTRAGWIAVAVVLLISGFFRRKAWLFLAVAVSIAALVAPQALLDRFSSIYTVTESRGSPYRSSSIDRYYILVTAINMIQKHPLIGVGLGTYEVNYHRYREAGASVVPTLPHNEYLRTWAEGGIGALAALLWIAYMILSQLFRAVRRAEDPSKQSLILGYFGSALSVFVFNLFSNNLNTMLTWMIMGVGMALAHEIEEDRRATLHRLQR